jgi:hypothetical protein
MKIFNIEIRKVLPELEEIRFKHLEAVEKNAIRGLVQAKLELRHHELLLKQAPDLNRTEAEIKGYEDAVERDKKTINNFQTQLKAIAYERQT